MGIKTTINNFTEQNFHIIYKTEGVENVTDADIILIGEIHHDHRFQEIYQDFINHFEKCTVLVEQAERGKLVDHAKNGMTWKIKPNVIVKGWDDIEYLNFCKEKLPISTMLNTKKAEANHHFFNTNDDSKLDDFYNFCNRGIVVSLLNKEQEESKKIDTFYPGRQESLINSILDESNTEVPVIAVGGYLHVKITPIGYVPNNSAELSHTESEDIPESIMALKDHFLNVDANPLTDLKEPEWKEKFHQVFQGKKIVLLVDKHFSQLLGTVDNLIDRRANVYKK